MINISPQNHVSTRDFVTVTTDGTEYDAICANRCSFIDCHGNYITHGFWGVYMCFDEVPIHASKRVFPVTTRLGVVYLYERVYSDLSTRSIDVCIILKYEDTTFIAIPEKYTSMVRADYLMFKHKNFNEHNNTAIDILTKLGLNERFGSSLSPAIFNYHYFENKKDVELVLQLSLEDNMVLDILTSNGFQVVSTYKNKTVTISQNIKTLVKSCDDIALLTKLIGKKEFIYGFLYLPVKEVDICV